MEAPNGNSTITAGLSSNNLSQWPPSFAETLELIRQNRIPYVDLSNQNLDATATRELAEAFNSNNTVVELCLCANKKIGDDGIIPLARMLERNRTLTALELVDIGLSSQGVRHLVTGLNNNVFILRLHLTEPGRVKIRKAKTHLQELDKILDSNAKFRGLLPDDIGTLAALVHLDVSHNALSDLPNTITSLSNLQTLRLSSNRITNLSRFQFDSMPKLQTIET